MCMCLFIKCTSQLSLLTPYHSTHSLSELSMSLVSIGHYDIMMVVMYISKGSVGEFLKETSVLCL